VNEKNKHEIRSNLKFIVGGFAGKYNKFKSADLLPSWAIIEKHRHLLLPHPMQPVNAQKQMHLLHL